MVSTDRFPADQQQLADFLSRKQPLSLGIMLDFLLSLLRVEPRLQDEPGPSIDRQSVDNEEKLTDLQLFDV